jgi:hypothetical protein
MVNLMNEIPLAERKLLYRVLHSQLTEHPELMDSQFLMELQRSLQQVAQAEGVDVANHSAWDEWLGNAPTACDVRVTGRRILQ